MQCAENNLLHQPSYIDFLITFGIMKEKESGVLRGLNERLGLLSKSALITIFLFLSENWIVCGKIKMSKTETEKCKQRFATIRKFLLINHRKLERK